MTRYWRTFRERLALGLWLLIGGVVADDDEMTVGFALQVESDVVEAALGFVVDTVRTSVVAVEGDGAEVVG